jgi:Holliday junction resolvase-like predicted endonuclease
VIHWKRKEVEARRAIEDRGYTVHDANILFRENCPNIDLVAFTKSGALYIQVKSSENPARRDCVVIDGSPWTEAQLHAGAPIFNKHDAFRAHYVLILDTPKQGDTNIYIAPPSQLEDLARRWALTFAARPKKDGTKRSIGFRKELTRTELEPWRNAWHLFPP